jgi:hypothetical protein
MTLRADGAQGNRSRLSFLFFFYLYERSVLAVAQHHHGSFKSYAMGSKPFYVIFMEKANV